MRDGLVSMWTSRYFVVSVYCDILSMTSCSVMMAVKLGDCRHRHSVTHFVPCSLQHDGQAPI